MPKILKVAALQYAISEDISDNLHQAKILITQAVDQGVNLVVLPELFYLPYFPKVKNEKYFDLARSLESCEAIIYMQSLAQELGVYLLTSFFELDLSKETPTYYNSLVLINCDGAIALTHNGKDRYRKSHIPTGPGYEEKFYFSEGDTGFVIWKTLIGNIGAGICWDQWYSEHVRIMLLLGADIVCYPTAIGSEPVAKELDTSKQWRRVMRGQATSNRMPIVASNRIGVEVDQDVETAFYGTSFITNEAGDYLQKAPYFNRESDVQDCTKIITANINLENTIKERELWGVFKRRPDLYEKICEPTITYGNTKHQ